MEDALNRLKTISAEQLQRVSLQRRFDTKFVCRVDRLSDLLANLGDDYAILCDDGRKIARYETQYFDTRDLRCFHDHRRGRRSRYKVRIRSYPERSTAFFEIKERTNRDETRKFRVERSHAALPAITGDEAQLILERTSLNPSALVPQLWTGFRRLTFVSGDFLERVTMDLDVEFLRQGNRSALTDLAIVEVKQGCYSRQSPIWRVLRSMGMRPFSVSKYCTGNALFSAARSESFYKEKFKRMERVRHG